jgi:predicted AAA+ superfamily ATPase
MKYEFHRDFYDLVLNSIHTNSTTFLLGTKKCGKTVCLKQIRDELPNSEYINFKEYTQNERLKILDRVFTDIKSDKDVVYLLDDMTSVTSYDIEICNIAEAYTDSKNIHTKTVFCGSQSVALSVCADRAFAGDACIMPADFLTYSEFLRFKGIKEVSEDSYNRYIMEIFDFYNEFISLNQYLRSCIVETVISNMKIADMVIGNETSLTEEDADFLIDVCRMSLFNLKNHVDGEIAQKISNAFIGSYNIIKSRDVEILREALHFLKNCGLITITPVSKEIENVSVRHPLIYMQMLREILGEDMPIEPAYLRLLPCFLNQILSKT